MGLATFVPSLFLFLGSSAAVALAAILASLATFAMVLFSVGPKEPQGTSSKGEGSQGNNPKPNPDMFISLSVLYNLEEHCWSGYVTLTNPWDKSDQEILVKLVCNYVDYLLNSISSLSQKTFDFEEALRPVFRALSRFTYMGSTGKSSDYRETPGAQLLAQLQAIVHKPLGFATSPSLPGTINSPW